MAGDNKRHCLVAGMENRHYEQEKNKGVLRIG